MKPKSTAQKQRDFRARKIAQGLTEVRGIWAAPKDHAEIRETVRALYGKTTTPSSGVLTKPQ